MLGTIVTAGGAGVRFGGEKILVPVAGKPLIFHTLERLQRVEGVGAVVLVLPGERIDAIRAEFGPGLAARGVTRIVPGGETRQASVRRGLEALPGDADPVLVHDAVRPCFSPLAASRAVARAREIGAALVAVPARDTLKRADPELRVRDTVPRDVVWHAETPQVVRREVLLEAYRRADLDGFVATDEASLVEHLGRPVALVRGGPWNVKVTEPADVAVVEAVLSAEEEGEA